MRKNLVLFFTLSLLTVINLYSQSIRDYSKWSFTLEYGYNYFDGDINQNITDLWPTSTREMTLGASVEYALTPVWGLALDYQYLPLKAHNNIPDKVDINTQLHSGSLNLTINFLRLIFPQNKSKFSLNASVGAGYAYYKTNPLSSVTGIPPTDVLLNDRNIPIFQASTFPVAFYADYNINRRFAIGAKLYYNSYNKDNLEGLQSLNWKGVTNDFVAAFTVYGRYKFKTRKHEHFRNNVSLQDFAGSENYNRAYTVVDNGAETALLKEKINELNQRINSTDNTNDSIKAKLRTMYNQDKVKANSVSTDKKESDLLNAKISELSRKVTILSYSNDSLKAKYKTMKHQTPASFTNNQVPANQKEIELINKRIDELSALVFGLSVSNDSIRTISKKNTNASSGSQAPQQIAASATENDIKLLKLKINDLTRKVSSISLAADSIRRSSVKVPATALKSVPEQPGRMNDLLYLKLNEISQKLENLNKNTDSIQVKVSNIEPRLNKIENEVFKKNSESPSTDSEAIKLSGVLKQYFGNDTVPAVYFDNEKTLLDKIAKNTISDVAKILKSNAHIEVEIRAYFDAANKDFNEKAGLERCRIIKNELVNVWGIPAERIKTNGNAMVPKSAYRFPMNRRCDLFFSLLQ